MIICKDKDWCKILLSCVNNIGNYITVSILVSNSPDNRRCDRIAISRHFGAHLNGL